MPTSKDTVQFSYSPSSEALVRAYQVIANSLSRQAGCAISVTFSFETNEIKLKGNHQKGGSK